MQGGSEEVTGGGNSKVHRLPKIYSLSQFGFFVHYEHVRRLC